MTGSATGRTGSETGRTGSETGRSVFFFVRNGGTTNATSVES